MKAVEDHGKQSTKFNALIKNMIMIMQKIVHHF